MRARIATVLLLGCVVAALGPAPAWGVGHLTYDFSFGSVGTGAGQFSSPSGVGINYTTGDVYVADEPNNRIEQFDADGNFIRMWGKDVNQTTPGSLCPINPNDACQPGVAGGEGGQLNRPRGVAVNSSTGAVYVQDRLNNRMQKFTADGSFVLAWGKGVDFATGGDFCTATSGHICKEGEVSTDGTPGQFSGWQDGGKGVPQLPAITIDPAGYVYVVDPHANPNPRVQKFDGDGTFISQVAGPNELFVEHGLDTPASIAVNGSGDAYVQDFEGAVSPSIKLFDSSQFTPSGITANWSLRFGLYKFSLGEGPEVLAIDPSNQYLFAGSNALHCEGATNPTGYHIDEFHPSGQKVDCTVPTAPSFAQIRTGVGGMAISTTHKLYASDTSADVVNVYSTPISNRPEISSQRAAEITATKAVAEADIAANLDDTTYHVEYGASPCSDVPNPCASTAESTSIGGSLSPLPVSAHLVNLTPDITYYYRFVAANGKGSDIGPDRSFHTFSPTVFRDCPNNLARQQTGAAFLLDCRAYELVSASDQGGYDVESDLVAGQTPFAGYPLAEDKALYGVHNGVVPNSGGKPTNRGLDPYLATRDAANQRWDASYVGIPSDVGSAAPFSSTLAEADAGLRSFAFGGADICNPCFSDGSVGIPIHRPDGSLIQGMAGSTPVALPVPAGTVKKHFSEDGRYFVFGSKQAFEPTANSNNADATLYERDLDTGATEVVSTDDSGNPIQNGTGITELDISANGRRVLFGKKIGQDSAGNPLYRLFMHLRGAPDSYQLTPGAKSGVLYAGMSADGSKAFFTTADQITADDHDSSADLYETDVDPFAAVSIHRVSVGELGSGDTDFCDPVGNSFNSDNWNVVPGGPADCSVVAIGGGGGVASGSGAVYFLSPEQLDTSGAIQPVQGAPNLYLARPGEDPKFVATLESELTGIPPLAGIYHGFKQNFGSFTRVTGVAVGPGGLVYVLDLGKPAFGPSPAVPARVKKFDAAGNPVNFTAGEGSGTNSLGGSDAPSGAFAPLALGSSRVSPTQIAVDQSTGKIYVPDYGHNVVDVFNSNGSYNSQLAISTPSGVALHPTNHDVYVTNRGANQVTRFPVGGGASSSFSVSSNSTTPSSVAVDSNGTIYVTNPSRTAVYDSSGSFVRVLDSNASFGVTVDPINDDVFVDEGTRFAQFDSSGAPTGGSDGQGSVVGTGNLSVSVGIALGPTGDVYTSNGGTAVAIFPRSFAPNKLIDSLLVLNALSAAGARHAGDFQATPSGNQAALVSNLALSGLDSDRHYEVFRYDAVSDQLLCASCNPTGLQPSTDASLASNGLSLTDDGRLFFDSGEQLVLRDTNQRKDAYEYSGDQAELISSGQSPFDSRLLSVTNDGTDAFFFTREKLAEADQNGSLTRIYDAREGGGFFVIPPAPQCAASDECHGASSPTPPTPTIGTNAGEGGNVPPSPRFCAKGKVRRKGRCVTRHPKKRHHKRAGAKREGRR